MDYTKTVKTTVAVTAASCHKCGAVDLSFYNGSGKTPSPCGRG